MSDQPVAWAMPRKDGLILDVITPEENAREPGQYTVPLYTQPKAEPVLGTKTWFEDGKLVTQNLTDIYKAEQEPVAWIEHEWSGSGLKRLHFERRDPTVRDEVVCPIWTPLYAAPQPKAEQEPVGTYEEVMQTMRSLQTGTLVAQQQMFELLKDKPLYAAPQPRRRLTDEEILEILGDIDANTKRLPPGIKAFARAIEAAVWGDGK
jgi:hypothetical protein